MITWIARVSLSTTLDHVKGLFESHQRYRDLIRKLIHYARSYYILCVLEFCNQILPDLQRALKCKTLQPTIINQLLGVCHVLGSMYAKKSSIRSSSIGD